MTSFQPPSPSNAMACLTTGSFELAIQEACPNKSDDFRDTHVFDLPHALLSSILARISDPISITFITCSCRLLRALSKSVPFCIKVSMGAKLDDGSLAEGGMQMKNSLTIVGVWTRKVLATIRRQMPATVVLDLSGCWIIDEDVAAVLTDLRCLKCLILDSCQKLTSTVADALAVSVRSGPRALSLQRCFGLGPAAAGNLLAAAAADGSRLQCILLSHLDRLDLPRDPPLLEVHDFSIESTSNKQGTGATNSPDTSTLGGRLFRGFSDAGDMGTGIQILALHNCGSLGAHELVAVGITCPMLKFLMLGGSTEGLCLSRTEILPSETMVTAILALVTAVECLRCLCVLEITFFPAFVVQDLRNHLGNTVEVWDFCERSSVYSALSFCSSKKKDLWPRCQEHENSHATSIKSGVDWVSRTQGWEENIILALRAAVNCCDMRRRTPLHVAASVGDTEMVRGVLCMGASPGLKDSAGATALFTAAWDGHSDICCLLLLSGADVLSRNRSGENALYIAALRGHSLAVEVMLSHCNTNHINWQSAEVYGDGWTPLMAAAVADRQDVAKVLLKAAGVKTCLDCWKNEGGACQISSEEPGEVGDSPFLHGNKPLMLSSETTNSSKLETENPQSNSREHPPPPILDAQNRYGQTALHIAARRASLWFVLVLLHAGASVDIRDEYQKRPVDIAYFQKHVVVSNVLGQWESQLKGNTPSSSSGRSPKPSNVPAMDRKRANSGNKLGASKVVWRPKVKKSTFGESLESHLNP